MTQLMGRPILGLPSELGARSPLADLLTGVRTALFTLAVVTLPILALWLVDPHAEDTAAGAFRLACGLWLLGHGGPMARGAEGVPVTVTPLLLTLIGAVLLHRAGRRIGRRTLRRGRARRRACQALCAGYLVVAGVAVTQCSAPEAPLRAEPLPDLLAVALLAAASLWLGTRSAPEGSGAAVTAVMARRVPMGAAGAAGEADEVDEIGWELDQGEEGDRDGPGEGGAAAGWWRAVRWPGWATPVGAWPVVGRAVGGWLLGMTAAGGTVLTAAVVVGGAGTSALTLGGGTSGYLGLLLACALLLPNAVLWAATYALGPGFAVGTGTVVAPTGTRLGALPDFPLLALVPGAGHAGGGGDGTAAGVVAGLGWGVVACGLPLLAAALPALLVGRAAAGGERRWGVVATATAGCGVAVGGAVAAAGAAWAAGGALAARRMSELGPVPWQAGAAAGAWLLGVGVPGALVVRWWLTRAGAEAHAPSGSTGRIWGARVRVGVYRAVVWAAGAGQRT
ncbi:DUF6350 family protein [Kitasatospora camelliae]|uniref:DUF6350 family protein n=1 Tax=Kitasatospora camelliae TaxID=3156397 RepID=A0AAU8JY04_9ACTN